MAGRSGHGRTICDAEGCALTGFFRRLLVKTRFKRVLFFLAADVFLLSFSIYAALWLRFEGQIPARFLGDLELLIPLAAGLKLPVFYLQGLYGISWSYVSVRELISVGKGVVYGSLLLGTAFFVFRMEPILSGFPRSVLVIDLLLSLVLVGGLRAARRVYLQFFKRFPLSGRRTLIVGAGDAGEQIARAMLNERRTAYMPVGLVDDDPAKRGVSIHGVRVLGPRSSIPELVAKYDVEELLIAMPSSSPAAVRETIALGREAGLKAIKTLPGFHELVTGQVDLGDIRAVQVEDLLGRDPVEVDVREVERELKGKAVLVTGAAGSIGAELCRQIVQFAPAKLLALDQDETGLFHLEAELREAAPDLPVRAVIADVNDRGKLARLFQSERPQVVFHAAAYKHVPLVEANPDEGVKNNVLGTYAAAAAAREFGAERFVLISTDKAVNPSSVMGATKRLAERVVQALNEPGGTRFSAVRFGNVLGSRGSVIPTFQAQIARGGPVTVTHPEVKRYFMVPSEAVLLVLQAGALGRGGEVFVLDMGEPVKIVELAREMIRLSGLEPDRDVPVVFTGLRPGEKLYEELLTAEEGTAATRHEKIFVARLEAPWTAEELETNLARLRELTQADRAAVIAALRELVPGYAPTAEGTRIE